MHYGDVKKSLTHRFVSSVKSSDRIVDYFDPTLSGFFLRVYPSGAKTYYVRPRRGMTKKIGDATVFTTGQAREVATEAIRAAASGGTHKLLGNVLKAPDTDPLTLEEFIDQEYGPYFRANHRNDKDLGNLNAFGSWPEDESIPAILDTELPDITADLVEAWRLQRLNAGTSPATINRNINALKACLQHAVKRRHLVKNPLAGFSRLQVDEDERVRYLTKGEEKRFRKALEKSDDQFRQMVLFTMNTGLRRGELLSLEWSSVTEATIDKRQVKVVEVKSGKSKSRRSRRIPLNAEARRVLAEIQQQSDLVFPSSITGRQQTDFRGRWAAVLADAKISDFRWHDLRHHFASRLVMEGIALNSVRALLGHSDIKMTLRYAHLAPGHLLDAVEAIAG